MKKWKIILTTIGSLLLIVAGGLYYYIEIREYDVADREVDEIVSSDYVIPLPEDDTVTKPESSVESTGEANDEKEETSTVRIVREENESSEEATTSTSKPINKESTESTKRDNKREKREEEKQDDDQEVTVISIKEKYRPSFENLQNQANRRVDALIAKAFSEFEEKRKNDESVSYGYFYKKYKDAADTLEFNTDAAFYTILEALETELKENGYSKKNAKSFEDVYNSEKEARESALLTKARDAL